ncbi:MAG: hypothetical protein D9V44_03130 [Actinobacteria bacterium]|nr:MAG: hypothetical protein D9V44_03130 [Actinomycetota bacterium]
MSVDFSSVSTPSGYETDVRYFAARYAQGGRQVYSFDLSLLQLASTLAKPDPAQVLEGNRRIRISHAEGFSEYLLTRDDWTSPPLLLRAPSGLLKFEPVDTGIRDVQFGVLSVPRLVQDELRIVDGQHRTLGIHLAWARILKDLDAARSHLAKAQKEHDVNLARHWEKELRRIEEQQERFARERMTVQLVVVDDEDAYKQIFVDIADNALGIPPSVRARFDRRKIVNRCLPDVMKHPLLAGHVDEQQDRISSKTPHLMSAKHVTDLIRVLQVGIQGRVSKLMNENGNEHAIINDSLEFLDVLVASFDDLRGIAEGTVSPAELRRRSLLGSVTMHRVLAGVYRELRNGNGGRAPMNTGEIERYFRSLSMTAPVADNSRWYQTGVFAADAMAPTARGGDMQTLVRAMVEWALRGHGPEVRSTSADAASSEVDPAQSVQGSSQEGV